jgi:hypothetical protein
VCDVFGFLVKLQFEEEGLFQLDEDAGDPRRKDGRCSYGEEERIAWVVRRVRAWGVA